jgi:O-antigen/teichoic acid export membrane protein
MFRKLLNLLSDAAVYGISSMLNRVVQLLLLPVLTDYLSTAEMGIIVMLSIPTALFAPLANLGMTNAIFRRFNQNKDPAARSQLFATGLLSVTLSSLVVLLVCLAFAAPLSTALTETPDNANLVRVSLLTAAITSVGMVPFVTFRAARRVKSAAAINVGKLVVTTAVTLLLVVGMQAGVWGVLIGSLVGEASLTLVQLAMTLSSFQAIPNWDTWRRMVSYGLPFVPHHMQAVGLDLFGMYMVGNMLGLSAVGIYGIATKLSSPVSFVVGAVQASWVPYKFQIHAEDPDPHAFFSSSFLYYVAGLSYLWVGVSLWGPEVIRLMTTSQFHAATQLVWAVALIPVSQGIYFMCGTGIELSENTRIYPLVSFAGLVVVIASAFLLVPLWGPLGAALSTVAGWTTMSVVVYVISQRRMRIHYDWISTSLFVLMAAAFVFAGMELQSQPLPIRIAAITLLSLAYPVIGFLLLARSRTERGRMLHLLTKLRLAPSNQ